jgi:hypothetical protein
MIKITYTISFPEPGGATVCQTLPVEIDNKISEFKSMASDLGCVINIAMNEDKSVLTVDHWWPEQNLLDIFMSVAAYDDFLNTYEAFIEGHGGTVVRTQEEA